MELQKEFRFEASHILPKHKGKCSRLHGHSWLLRVFVDGVIDPETNFVKDYAEISQVVKPLIESMDHKHLGQWVAVTDDGRVVNPLTSNDAEKWHVPEMPLTLYPSSENLVFWIADQLTPNLNWSKLCLEETCTSSCTLTRNEYILKTEQTNK